MTFDEYQKEAVKFAIYPDDARLLYPLTLLAEEAGEAVGKIAKHLRGDGAIDFRGLEKELGDVLWALANVADDMGSSLSIIARQNLEKLEDRKARGVITGSGDNR